MGCITLTTDFGLHDGYAGVMRGVIWGIAPLARVADLSHQVGPQNILEGALILSRHGRFFPPGTIHIGVVDPGVGTPRRPIAARLGGQYFTGPDNGLCSLLLDEAEKAGGSVEIIHLDQPRYWLPEVSAVFHGRDIFAPVAAHLLNGVPLNKMGTPIEDPVRLHIPRPVREGNRRLARVLYIDIFGNIAANIRHEDLGEFTGFNLDISGVSVRRFVYAYGEAAPGELVALIGSSGYLEVAEVNGNASRRLGVAAGDPIVVILEYFKHQPDRQ